MKIALNSEDIDARQVLFSGLCRNDILLSKSVIFNSKIRCCSQICKVSDASIKAHVVCKLIAENAGRVKKSEDLFPLFKIGIQFKNPSCSEVVVFTPVWPSLILCK